MAQVWSRIATSYEVLQHRISEIAAGYEARFRRREGVCHDDTGSSLLCQCFLRRAFMCQPPISMLSSIRVRWVGHVQLREHWGTSRMNSVKRVTKTLTVNVKVSFLH